MTDEGAADRAWALAMGEADVQRHQQSADSAGFQHASQILRRLCRQCGTEVIPRIVFDAPPPHHARYRCPTCSSDLGWVKKPENEGKRSDHNQAHRLFWVAKHDGDLRCSCCGGRRSEMPRVDFHIDHQWALEDDGPDETWNTQVLCRDCHQVKNAMRAHRLHVLGRSARADPDAA